MQDGNQNNTQALLSAQSRYEFSNDPRAWKPIRKETWIFPVEDEKSIKELREKEAQAFLQSDEFFASWDNFCAKLDETTAMVVSSTPQPKTIQLSILDNAKLAA